MAKTVLVTGASSGIGLALAHIFAREGYNLVLVARSFDKLFALKDELEKRYKISAEVFCTDLSCTGAAKKVFGFTQEKGLEIDILVNNAGFGDFGFFSSRELSRQHSMLELNIVALTELTHLYLPLMLGHGSGKILNLASTAAFQAGPLMSVYYASKAYVLSFSEALSVELKGSGVSVTALCPGPTRTGFEKNANLGSSGLFRNLKPDAVKKVAEAGYNGLMSGKTIVVPGLWNKLLIIASKLSPRALTRRIIYLIQKAR